MKFLIISKDMRTKGNEEAAVVCDYFYSRYITNILRGIKRFMSSPKKS